MEDLFERPEARPGQGVSMPRGVPPVPSGRGIPPELAALLLTQHKREARIGEKDVQRATEILRKYKEGKANLETRIVDDELWWELRHWESIRSGKKHSGSPHGPDGIPIDGPGDAPQPEPSSAWLFNSILNKHADAMDNYPEPIALPRERDDEESAKALSSVLPVVLEYNEYEQTYSDNWWEKLKHGTAAYGVFWNSEKENGLGDIDIKEIDLLKLFWEPGITDIQRSRNLFITELVDDDLLEQEYPQLRNKAKGNAVDIKEYLYDDTVDTTGKSVVVDWYYKVKQPGGQSLLHYVKFVGSTLLYASENEPKYQDQGYYDHGLYPVVLDVLFPEKGTPVGFGYVAICKDPQLYIDKLSANILENSMMATKRRWFVSENTAVNEEELMDWNRPLVHVAGEIDDKRLQEILCQPLPSIYLEVMQLKIEEMKDTAANRDVNSGGTSSGVTAAAAIAALQEAGNKASRDMISASYRAHVSIASLCIELIRQFYDETRSFRITGTGGGGYDFVELSNAKLKDQEVGTDSQGTPLFRRPIFDIKIKAQKKNPFSRMEQNERAKELYGMGFFDPNRAQEALCALEMMEFEGIDKLRDQVRQGQTLLNICMQQQQEMQQMSLLIQSLTGGNAVMGGSAPSGNGPGPAPGGGAPRPESGLARGVMQAHTPMTGYGQALAKRSTPSMDRK